MPETYYDPASGITARSNGSQEGDSFIHLMREASRKADAEWATLGEKLALVGCRFVYRIDGWSKPQPDGTYQLTLVNSDVRGVVLETGQLVALVASKKRVQFYTVEGEARQGLASRILGVPPTYILSPGGAL